MRVTRVMRVTGVTRCSSWQGCCSAPARARWRPLAPGRLAASSVATTALVNVSVVPLDSERVLAGHTVLVQGERIVALGSSASLRVPAGARVIDGRSKYLMPALADMHTHLVRREDLLLYLALGVTTVRNMWGTPLHLAWRD